MTSTTGQNAMVPSIYALLIAVTAPFLTRTGILRLQVIACLFGGTSALVLTALGGATITIDRFCLLFLCISGWLERRRERDGLYLSRAGFWLCAAMLWGICVTALVPRLMRGDLLIMAIDRSGGGSEEAASTLQPLAPVSGNMTQGVFAIASVLTFLAARQLLQKEHRVIAFRDAMLTLSTLNCLAGILNLLEFYAGLPSLLTYVRTAYLVYDTYAIGGIVRIHGTFPEASAFAGFTLPLYSFSLYLWLNRVRPVWSGSVALLQAVFLAISTSGTAYVGFVLYTAILSIMLVRRAIIEGWFPRSVPLFTIGLVGTTLIAVALVSESPLLDQLNELAETFIFDKVDSSSGEERGSWNAQAFQNFLDSYGLGVGIGTVRSSSIAFAFLSNVGLVGTVCYLLFLVQVFRPAPPHLPQEIQIITGAARQALIGALATALLVAANIDPGVPFYLYAAVASLRDVEPAEVEEDEAFDDEDEVDLDEPSYEGQPHRV